MEEKTFALRPVIILALKVWLLYTFFAGVQDAYHEVVCEGGYDTVWDKLLIGVFLFGFVIMQTYWFLFVFIAFYGLLSRTRTTPGVSAVLFLLGSFLLCLLCWPVIDQFSVFYGIRDASSDWIDHIWYGIKGHYLITNKMYAAALAPILVLLLQRKRTLALISSSEHIAPSTTI